MKQKLFLTVSFYCLFGIATNAQQPKGNFKKNYNSDCQKCADPWVGDAFYKVWGICPSNSGGQDSYCNINLWNNASWSSYENLTNIIRNKYTSSISVGNAYIFIKPQNVNFEFGKAGHIGWGFQLSDGSYYCGATENYAHKIAPSQDYIIHAGKDNDFWAEKCYNEGRMFQQMKSLGYTQYKVIGINKPNLLAAKKATEEIMYKGFQGISNNCLDHTYTVLAALGLNILQLPSRQIYLFPNKWFNEFYPKVNGNGVFGKNL